MIKSTAKKLNNFSAREMETCFISEIDFISFQAKSPNFNSGVEFEARIFYFVQIVKFPKAIHCFIEFRNPIRHFVEYN